MSKIKSSLPWLIAFAAVSASLTVGRAALFHTELTQIAKSQSKHRTILHECITPSGLKFYSNRPCSEIIEGSHYPQ